MFNWKCDKEIHKDRQIHGERERERDDQNSVSVMKFCIFLQGNVSRIEKSKRYQNFPVIYSYRKVTGSVVLLT